jgi:hypothetical protein
MMKDADLDLLLRLRRTQPREWAILEPSVKLQALGHEAEKRERAELENEEREETRAA